MLSAVVVVNERIACALVVPGVLTGRLRDTEVIALPRPARYAWFVAVPVPVATFDMETIPPSPEIWTPTSVIATDVPVKAGKGLKDGVRTIVLAVELGVTSVWVGEVPMLNLAGAAETEWPLKVIVIGVELALV